MTFKPSREFWIGVALVLLTTLFILGILGMLAACAQQSMQPRPIAPDEYRLHQAKVP